MESRTRTLNRGEAPLGIRDGLNPSRVRVPAEFDGTSAYEFLETVISGQRRKHLADDHQALAARFADGLVVTTRGQQAIEVSPTDILHEGTDIWFYRIPAEEKQVPYTCEILYEDDNLLVVDKPPFLATMPRGKHITQTATVQLRRMTGINDLSPAHRLDRLTSGILVFTKKKEVRGAYQNLFAERNIQKTYAAIAPYDPELTPGTIWRNRMEKIAGHLQATIEEGEINAETLLSDVIPLPPEEQERLETLHGSQPPLACYMLKPHTGKTHQLRLHMWAAGVPILGDPAYPTIQPEEEEDFLIPMHLTATELEFTDPLSGKPQHFHSQRIW